MDYSFTSSKAEAADVIWQYMDESCFDLIDI